MRCAVLLAVSSAAPIAAQAPACERVAPPPVGLEAWAQPAATGVFRAGRRTTIMLRSDVKFLIPPAKTPDETALGAMVPFRVTTAGTYRVALSEGAWIDVVRTKEGEPSVAHAHGPTCSGIRKMVDFQLKPSAYVLQLSGASAAKVDVLIVAVK